MVDIYNNILETIGNTPVVKINRLAPPAVPVESEEEAHRPSLPRLKRS